MAVFEHAEGGFAPAFVMGLARALGSLALTGVVVGPLLFGALVGHLVTERLDDPEAMEIKANLPIVSPVNVGGTARKTDG
jgi:hypothetical protein